MTSVFDAISGNSPCAVVPLILWAVVLAARSLGFFCCCVCLAVFEKRFYFLTRPRLLGDGGAVFRSPPHPSRARRFLSRRCRGRKASESALGEEDSRSVASARVGGPGGGSRFWPSVTEFLNVFDSYLAAFPSFLVSFIWLPIQSVLFVDFSSL